jgi:hypothetical protein
MRDEENDRPAFGKRNPLEVEAMDDNYIPTLSEEVTEAQQWANLASQIADWIEAGGRQRMLAVCDFLIDEFGLDAIEGARIEPSDPSALDTIKRWVNGGTGPRDFDQNRFDVQR